MCRNVFALCAMLLMGCSAPHTKFEMGKSIPLGKGEFSVSYVEARNMGEGDEIVVYFGWTGPANDVLPGFFGSKMKIRLHDSAGNTYRPSRPSWSHMEPAPEQLYYVMRRFEEYRRSAGRDDSFEADAEDLTSQLHQLDDDLKAGRNPVKWVHTFKVKPERHGFWLAAENPDRQPGQPGSVEVSLGR
jgi:hypothetical protein